MLDINWIILLILFFSGLAAGTVDAIAGGGGLISLPILLGVGVPAPLALGTNKLQASMGTFIASYNYFKNGFISFKVILKGLFFGFLGTTLGALAVQLVDPDGLQKYLPFLMALVFIYSFYSPRLGLEQGKKRIDEPIFYILFGFVLGFYDGFFGPGTGSLWVIALVFFLGYHLPKATAYTKVFNLKSNIIATLWFAYGHHIDYQVALVMACGQLFGGKLGSQLVICHGAHFVRPVFLLVTFTSIIVLIFRDFLFF